MKMLTFLLLLFHLTKSDQLVGRRAMDDHVDYDLICDKVVDLSEIDGNTYDGETTGAMNDYEVSCGGYGGYGEEKIFRLPLQPGATINIRQAGNNYDSMHELRAGVTCPGEVLVNCMDDDTYEVSYTNTEVREINVWFIIDGYGGDSGTFTLSWNYGEILTGEQACENHGYNKWECNTIGCCQWDDFGYGECHSAVSDTLCYDHVDYSSLQSIGIIITIVAVVMVFFISCVCYCCKCCCCKKKKDVIQPQSPQKVVVSETDMSPEAVKRRKMIAKAKQAQKDIASNVVQIPGVDAIEKIADIASNAVEKLDVSDNVLIQVSQSAETLVISCAEEVSDEPPAYNEIIYV